MVLSDLREIKEQVIYEYTAEKKSTGELAKKYACYPVTVLNLLKENNVLRRTPGESLRVYSLNEHYLDEIDTQDKAYFLGFFYADGCNQPRNRCIFVELAKEDEEVLEYFKKIFDYEGPIKHNKGRPIKGKDYMGQDTSKLILNSVYLNERMTDLGAPPRKTNLIKWPNWLRKDLIPHFIRGYFDGDGTISKMGSFVNISIVSTPSFLEDMKKVIEEQGIIVTGIHKSTNSKAVKKLEIQRQSEIKKFLDWIYCDANFYLKRKYDRYYKYFYLGEPIVPYK